MYQRRYIYKISSILQVVTDVSAHLKKAVNYMHCLYIYLIKFYSMVFCCILFKFGFEA